MKSILIIGASRGIGAELVEYFSKLGHNFIGVYRSRALNCEWIKSDVTSAESIKYVAKQMGGKPIDVLIFSSGIWGKDGFSETFDFRKTNYEETHNIMLVNLVTPIELTKASAKKLSISTNPRKNQWGQTQLILTH